jgi:hypothetical protein
MALTVLGTVEDVPRCPLFGRYRTKSGRSADIVKLSLLTHAGHLVEK